MKINFLKKIEEKSDEKYDGELFEGKKHGKGTHTTKKFIYKGIFEDDNMEGYGELTNLIDNSILKGFFRRNLLNGPG